MTRIKAFQLIVLASGVVSAQSFNFFGIDSAKRRISFLLAEKDDKGKFFTTEVVDVTVPYYATVDLAYKLSDQSMKYDDFKEKYLADAVELVKSKGEPVPEKPKVPVELPRGPPGVEVPYDAAARLAYEFSDSRLGFEDYKKIYLEEAVNLVKSKQKYTRVMKPTSLTPKPPGYRPPPPSLVDPFLVDFVEKAEKQKEKYFGAAAEFLKSGNVSAPEFNPEIQEGVPTETVKGAVLLTAGLALLTSKGIIISGAAGVGAAVAAIQRGTVGDVFRTVGGATWDAAEASAKLYKQATADGKMVGLTKELAATVAGAVHKVQGAEERVKESYEGSDTEEITAAEESLEESSEDLTRILEEAEVAIGQADAAMALADETLGKNDEEEEDISEDEEVYDESEEEEMARLREELRMAEGDVLEDEDVEETVDEDKDEWGATLEIAQQGIDGKIVGIDEVINDDGAKADWDAAGMLAQELQQAGGEDDDEEAFTSDDSDMDAVDDMLPEGDLDDIARAAREAVAMMEGANFGVQVNINGDDFAEEPTETIRILRDWSKLTVAKLRDELRNRGLGAYGKKADLIAALEKYDAEYASESIGLEAADEEDGNSSDNDLGLDFDGVDLEMLGRQARAAVQAFEDINNDSDEAVKVEEDNSSDSESNVDEMFAGLDLEALGKEARAAVDGQFVDEPSDDVLQELEDELFEPAKDFSSMTVAQLKDELRSQGLRVSGRKAELIERLQNA